MRGSTTSVKKVCKSSFPDYLKKLFNIKHIFLFPPFFQSYKHTSSVQILTFRRIQYSVSYLETNSIIYSTNFYSLSKSPKYPYFTYFFSISSWEKVFELYDAMCLKLRLLPIINVSLFLFLIFEWKNSNTTLFDWVLVLLLGKESDWHL